MSTLASKVCGACGRRFEWRRKWARDWDRVRYCSGACRRRRVSSHDEELERAILALLCDRSPGASICPSEAARAAGDEGWRRRMESVRRAARRLAARGRVEITQGGRVVDPSACRGPIRVRLSGSAR